MLSRHVRRLRWMISSSPGAANAAETQPDSSTMSGVRLPLTCGGVAGGGGAKDCVGSALLDHVDVHQH
eukprot:12440465-Prorocentrum_lima.AAC.1